MDIFHKHLMMFTLLVLAGCFVFNAQSQTGTTSSDGEYFRLLLVDNISNYTADGEKNVYNNKLRLQNINLTAADLNDGDNFFLFHRVDDGGAEVIFATLNLQASGYGPRTVVPALTYHNDLGGYGVLNYESRTYAKTDSIDLYGIIDYVNDVFEAGTADNTHSAYYNYYVTYDTNVSAIRSGKDNDVQ